MKVLRKGDRGEEVRQLQGLLHTAQDGVFGALTEEALKAWQNENGLFPDGICGPKTWAKLLPEGGLTLKRSRRRIDEIIVHCTATPEGQAKTVDDIRREHKAQGWSDIGYHYLVTLDGVVHNGRDVDVSGAHAEGHNSHSIGVCYVGGVENDPRKPYAQLQPKDTRTAKQRAALLSLLKDLRRLYPSAKIIGHRNVDRKGKACPSFDAKNEYKGI
jgi:N-acetylmuramoyl-L-alanine amidase